MAPFSSNVNNFALEKSSSFEWFHTSL
jgi:hypothetical protein